MSDGKPIQLPYARPKPSRRIPLLALIYIVLFILMTSIMFILSQ